MDSSYQVDASSVPLSSASSPFYSAMKPDIKPKPKQCFKGFFSFSSLIDLILLATTYTVGT